MVSDSESDGSLHMSDITMDDTNTASGRTRWQTWHSESSAGSAEPFQDNCIVFILYMFSCYMCRSSGMWKYDIPTVLRYASCIKYFLLDANSKSWCLRRTSTTTRTCFKRADVSSSWPGERSQPLLAQNCCRPCNLKLFYLTLLVHKKVDTFSQMFCNLWTWRPLCFLPPGR